MQLHGIAWFQQSLIDVAMLHNAQSLLAGYADDGGMLLPKTLPKISKAQLQRWSKLGYLDLVVDFLKLFAGDEIPEAELRKLVHASFSQFTKR